MISVSRRIMFLSRSTENSVRVFKESFFYSIMFSSFFFFNLYIPIFIRKRFYPSFCPARFSFLEFLPVEASTIACEPSTNPVWNTFLLLLESFPSRHFSFCSRCIAIISVFFFVVSVYVDLSCYRSVRTKSTSPLITGLPRFVVIGTLTLTVQRCFQLWEWVQNNDDSEPTGSPLFVAPHLDVLNDLLAFPWISACKIVYSFWVVSKRQKPIRNWKDI